MNLYDAQERWDSGWRVHGRGALIVASNMDYDPHDYWASRHWVAPALYSPDDWYELELERLTERAPA